MDGASDFPPARGGGVQTQQRTRLSMLERGLRLFTDIRAGEGTTGLVLFVNVFLILCAYYFIKPLRESWIAVSDIAGLSKMEVKAYSSFGQSLLLVFIVSAYGRLSTRWPRDMLITRATIACMVCLVGFWMVQPGFLLANLPGSGIAFYLWVGMFGVFIVAQFWAFAADLYAGERGGRLLPLIGIGATAGAAAGSFLTEWLVQTAWFDSGTLLLLATIPLGASILLMRVADVRGPLGAARGERARPRTPAAASDDGDRHGALAFVFRHRYLFAVALVALMTNWVNTNGENLLFRVVQEALEQERSARGITDQAATISFVREGTAVFYGNFYFWVNVTALLLQALVASRLLAYGGFGAILMLLPGIALISYSMMAIAPILAVVRVMKVAENSVDYSINNTARQVLWLPTTAAMKYKAKPVVDSLFVRLGDGCAALTVLLGVQLLALSTRSFFLVNVALTLVWIAASIVIVREHDRLVAAGSRKAEAA
jgi:ATP:ADP antiporter, AAA family